MRLHRPLSITVGATQSSGAWRGAAAGGRVQEVRCPPAGGAGRDEITHDRGSFRLRETSGGPVENALWGIGLGCVLRECGSACRNQRNGCAN